MPRSSSWSGRSTSRPSRIAELSDHCPPAVLERYGHDLERFSHEGGYEAHARVDAVLHGLGFDPEAAHEQTAASLSGGEAGRLGLARQLAAPADLLLLDEPTNHLDLDTTAWLESYLLATRATVLVVSHDRAFLARVADHMLHLEARRRRSPTTAATPSSCGSAPSGGSRRSGRTSSSGATSRRRRTTSAATSPAGTASRPRGGGGGWSGSSG